MWFRVWTFGKHGKVLQLEQRDMKNNIICFRLHISGWKNFPFSFAKITSTFCAGKIFTMYRANT